MTKNLNIVITKRDFNVKYTFFIRKMRLKNPKP